jgi:CHAT domain-containing protein
MRSLGDDHGFIGVINSVISDPLFMQTDVEAAEQAAQSALSVFDGVGSNLALGQTVTYQETREALETAQIRLAGEEDVDARLARLEALLASKQSANAPDVSLSEAHLLIAQHHYGQSDFAASDAAMTRALDLSAGFDPDNAWALSSRVSQLIQASSNAHDQGDAKTATTQSEAALSLLRQHADERHVWLGEAYSGYASALYLSQRHHDAVKAGNTAIRILRDQSGGEPTARLGVAMVNTAAAYHGIGNLEGSEQLFMEAYEVLKGMGGVNELYAGICIDNAAKAANDLGKLDVASERYAEAERILIAEAGAAHPNLGASYLTHADTLYRLGEFEAARDKADHAADILTAVVGEDHIYVRLARSTALLAQSRIDPSTTRVAVNAQIDAAEKSVMALAVSNTGWTEGLGNSTMSLGQMAEASMTAGDMDAALRALQMRNMTDVSEADQRRALRKALQSDDARALEARLGDLRALRDGLQDQLTAALTANETSGVEEFQERLSDAEFALAATSEALFEQVDPDALVALASLSDIQAALGPRDAVLILSDYYTMTGILIGQDTVNVSEGETDRGALRLQIKQFTKDLRGPDGSVRTAAFRQAHADALFGNTRDAMAKIDTLYVIDRSAASHIPLALLPDPAAPGAFLSDRVAITYLSNVPALLRPKAEMRLDDLTFLGVGDPNFSGAPLAPIQLVDAAPVSDDGAVSEGFGNAFIGASLMRSGSADIAGIRALSRLPASRQEITAIAGNFPPAQVTTLLDDAATEAVVRGLTLSDYSVISFATHGLLSGEIGGLSEPALVLSPPVSGDSTPENDGLLLASEIADMEFDARLVILSACNSAGSRDFQGLPQAFLLAGAESLMVARWPVRDDAAQYLTTRVVAGMKEGKTASRALSDAAVSLRTSDLPDADHPTIWAPFVIVGG